MNMRFNTTGSFCYFAQCFRYLPQIVNDLELGVGFTAGCFHYGERCEIIEEENAEEKEDKGSE